MKKSLELKEVREDTEMESKTQKVINILESTSKRQVDNKFIHEILKIQDLVKEFN